jgi:hypothetical protein
LLEGRAFRAIILPPRLIFKGVALDAVAERTGYRFGAADGGCPAGQKQRAFCRGTLIVMPTKPI